MIDDVIAKDWGWEMNEVTDDKWQCQRDDKGWEQTERESNRVRPNLHREARKEAVFTLSRQVACSRR